MSWALRSTRDRGIDDCAGDYIGRIRLWWRTDETSRFTAFTCEANHGVTAFDLPVGEVALSVEPECGAKGGPSLDGLPPPSEMFVTPPPIVRQVAVGETVTLDAVLLVVKVDDCMAATCICGRPCDCAQATGAPLATDPGTKHPDPRGEEP